MTCHPIFIVGMPRSGTKLLRELLNQHSEVSIPDAETAFLPFLYKNIHLYGDLREPINFNRLYYDVSQSTFFSYISDADQIWDIDKWYNILEDYSLSSVISGFYRLHAKYEMKTIWGDKTPSYMLHIPLIIKLFPNAKIIHIYRDVRDYCLSMRKAWGKNIYRAAERWKRDIMQCMKDGEQVGKNSYLELKYENLIKNTEKEIKKICFFTKIEFEPQMVRPKKPVENLGDAKGQSEILKKNYNKWETKFKAKEIKKIEEIAGSFMNTLGYEVKYSYGYKRLNRNWMFYLKLLDSLNLFIFRLKAIKSLTGTIKWIVKHKRQN